MSLLPTTAATQISINTQLFHTNHMTSSQRDRLKRVTCRGALNRVMLTFLCIKTLGRSASCRAQEPSFAKGTR